MSVNIYCIEDCNNKKYIGSTKQKYLSDRLAQHRYYKKNQHKHRYSSCKLDLDNCKISLLELCNKDNRREREQYWINNSKCVNELNALWDKENYDKKQYDILLRDYRKSWGGDIRYNHNNNFLLIDVNLFTYP